MKNILLIMLIVPALPLSSSNRSQKIGPVNQPRKSDRQKKGNYQIILEALLTNKTEEIPKKEPKPLRCNSSSLNERFIEYTPLPLSSIQEIDFSKK